MMLSFLYMQRHLKKQQIDSVIARRFNSLVLSFGPKILDANQIALYLYIKYL